MSAGATAPQPAKAVAPTLDRGLEVRDLACRRGARWLFRELHARVDPGSLLRVAGDNGAGKTSLLRLICGLSEPAAGQVLWRGQPLRMQREDFNRQLIYLGHATALKDDLSALENLCIAARLGGEPVDAAAARTALAAAGLAGRERLPARVLSQGQRRRTALARLMVQPAGLWVLDEPFNALDGTAVDWLAALMQSHLARGGMLVLTSHQPLPLPAGLPQASVAL